MKLGVIFICENNGYAISTPFTACWPHELADLGDAAPQALWTAGDAGLLEARGKVTVLGGRSGSVYGRGRAIELARGLAQRGRVLVTPANTGSDIDVANAAIDAGGGRVHSVRLVERGVRRDAVEEERIERHAELLRQIGIDRVEPRRVPRTIVRWRQHAA